MSSICRLLLCSCRSPFLSTCSQSLCPTHSRSLSLSLSIHLSLFLSSNFPPEVNSLVSSLWLCVGVCVCVCVCCVCLFVCMCVACVCLCVCVCVCGGGWGGRVFVCVIKMEKESVL